MCHLNIVALPQKVLTPLYQNERLFSRHSIG
jgi:hypothetical protein